MSQQQQTVLRVQISGSTVFQTLDLYSSIPIKVNRSYADLQDISSKNSDTALNVKLPGSKKNNAFFENFFDVDTQSFAFNAIKKVYAQVLINDEAYFTGYMRLDKINIQNSKVEYDVSLYSTVGTLFADIGNKLLKDLNFDDSEYTFNHTFGLGAVTNGWYTSNFSRNSEKPQTYLYPIVHNGYLYDNGDVNFSGNTIDSQTRFYTSSPIKAGAYPTAADAFDDGVEPYKINSPGSGLIDNQLKPALSIWNLLQLMFKTYGYKIKSDFMNTPWMKTLYMYGYFSADLTKFSYTLQNIQTLPPSGVDIVVHPSTGYTEFDLIVAQQGTGIPCYCSDEIKVTITIERAYHGFLGIVFTEKYDETYTVYPSSTGTTVVLNQYFPANTIYRHYDASVQAISGYYNVGFAPYSSLKYDPVNVGGYENFKDGDPVNFSLVIDPQFKQIDFLSSIAKKFNLVFVPDPEVANQIIIEPYTYYIGTGDIWDWTDKLSHDQGFSIEPAINYVDSYLTFYDQEDGDYGNVQFKNRNNRIYGQKFVPNNTDFKSTTGETHTTFSTEIFRQWDAIELPNGTIADSGHIRLPLGINYAGSTSEVTANNQVQANYEYTGVKTKPKLMWFLQGANPLNEYSVTGKTYNFSYSATTYNVWVGPSNAPTGTTSNVYLSQENIPVMSNTMPIGIADKYKINNDNLSVLFNAEQLSYIDVYTYNVYTTNDAYLNFYYNRISNVLFNPNTRFLKGKFYLKLSDYKNLKAKDLIKIKDQYFTWNKVINYNITDTELTEVELVQANLNPNIYPKRYFKLKFCDAPEIFKIEIDFTNPNLLKTNYGWSIFYDHNSAIVFGNNQPTGFTSSFSYDVGSTTYFVPYFIQEITETEYNTPTYYDLLCSTMAQYVYNQPQGAFGYNMKSYWVNSGNTKTGLNLFKDCSTFSTIATREGIAVGSSTYYGPVDCYKLTTEVPQDIKTQDNNFINIQH